MRYADEETLPFGHTFRVMNATQIGKIDLAQAIFESALQKINDLGMQCKSREVIIKITNTTVEPKSNYKRRV